MSLTSPVALVLAGLALALALAAPSSLGTVHHSFVEATLKQCRDDISIYCRAYATPAAQVFCLQENLAIVAQGCRDALLALPLPECAPDYLEFCIPKLQQDPQTTEVVECLIEDPQILSETCTLTVSKSPSFACREFGKEYCPGHRDVRLARCVLHKYENTTGECNHLLSDIPRSSNTSDLLHQYFGVPVSFADVSSESPQPALPGDKTDSEVAFATEGPSQDLPPKSWKASAPFFIGTSAAALLILVALVICFAVYRRYRKKNAALSGIIRRVQGRKDPKVQKSDNSAADPFETGEAFERDGIIYYHFDGVIEPSQSAI